MTTDAPDEGTGSSGPLGTSDTEPDETGSEPTPGSDNDGAEAGYTPPPGSDDPVSD